MPDQETVRIGFVGAGDMAQLAHIVNYWNQEGVELAALAEGRAQTAELVARTYGFKKVYPDHLAMLADAKLDGVVAVLPFALNGEVVEDVLSAGVHVLTEKPQVMTAARGRELVELAHRKGLHYHVGYMKRFDPGVQWARRILGQWMQRGDELGALQSMRIWCGHGRWYWFRRPHLDAGDEVPDYQPKLEVKPDWMTDAGWQRICQWTNFYSHQTNLARYLTGQDYTLDTIKRVGESFYVQNTYTQSGAQLYFDFSAFACDGWHEGFEAVFERARLTARIPAPLADQQAARIVAYEHPPQGEPRHIEPSLLGPDGFRRQAEHFIALLRGETEPMSPAVDAVKEVEYAETLVRRMQDEGMLE